MHGVHKVIFSKAILRGTVAGVVVFAVCQAVDIFSKSIAGAPRVFDNVLAGLIVAFLIFAYERQRSRNLAEKLKMIALMNHHIRNALQTIIYSIPKQQTDQAERIKESVSQIDWALREVLPGGLGTFADENAFTDEK